MLEAAFPVASDWASQMLNDIKATIGDTEEIIFNEPAL